jgi:hypothetical protein
VLSFLISFFLFLPLLFPIFASMHLVITRALCFLFPFPPFSQQRQLVAHEYDVAAAYANVRKIRDALRGKRHTSSGPPPLFVAHLRISYSTHPLPAF